MKKEWIQVIVRLSGAFLFVFQIGISPSMLPAGVEESSPAETGVYQEFFSSYNNLDFVRDLEWNIWKGILRIPMMDGVNQEQPQVASDNNGNTYIVWQDERSGDYDIYAQKLDADGNPLWETEMRVPATTGSKKTNPDVASDLNGNLVVVWSEYNSGFPMIYAQKLDGNGNRLWADDAAASVVFDENQDRPSVAVDMDNNIVIAWSNWGNFGYSVGTFAQKLDADGNRLWDDDLTIYVDEGTSDPSVGVDNYGYIFIVWEDFRNEFSTENDIYACKVTPDGDILWGADLRVNSDLGSADQEDPKLIVDGGGSIYVVWGDKRNGNSDIYAQKLSSAGSKVWSGDKRVDSDSGSAVQKRPDLSDDGSGNFVVVWEDYRNTNADIYSQKINSRGDVIGANDLKVHNYGETADQRLPSLILDSEGYLVVAWEDYRHGNGDIYAQKLNINGARQWDYDVRVPVHLDATLAFPDVAYLSGGAAQSRTVDTIAGQIRQATLTANYQSNGGEVRFFMSHNGGNSWSPVTPGVTKVFSTPGSDLRWIVELEADPLRLQTPVINSLNIDYSTQVFQGYTQMLPIVFR